MPASVLIKKTLEDELLRGEYAPGDRIDLDELTDRFQVSRIPVRDAVLRMVAKGVLRSSHRGFFVPDMDPSWVEEVYALRMEVESLLLRRAFDRLTEAHLATAQTAHLREDLSINEMHWEFHRTLYEPSGWTHGLDIVRSLYVSSGPFATRLRDIEAEVVGPVDHHAEIIEACQTNNLEQATEALRRDLTFAADLSRSALAA